MIAYTAKKSRASGNVCTHTAVSPTIDAKS